MPLFLPLFSAPFHLSYLHTFRDLIVKGLSYLKNLALRDPSLTLRMTGGGLRMVFGFQPDTHPLTSAGE